MKKLVVIILFFSLKGYGQLAVNIIIPPGGFVQKQQLWNILITNPNSSAVTIRIETLLTEALSGQPVLSAATGYITLPTGTIQLSASSIGPVQYNSTNGSYFIDPGPTGLLPVGQFKACYNFLTVAGKSLAQDCEELNIQPLSPLLLAMPANHSVLENGNPNFTWIPFSSAQMFSNLTYSMKIVEVYPGQSPADATQKNMPLYTTHNISSPSLFYGQTSPLLEKAKLYAWQISAMNNLTEITKSETWDFSIGEKPAAVTLNSDPVYVKLKKESEGGGYCLFYGSLLFEHFNETSDTTWNVELLDISANKSNRIRIPMLDTLKMARGENLIKIQGESIGMKDKHIYSLQIRNSRQETWQLKFEYRKEEQ